MSERSHRQRIEALEHEILQQRLEMTAAMREWRDATAPIDNAWEKLMSWRVPLMAAGSLFRSEERRVGKECRSRWSPYH